jgi:hypothetical protein
MTIYYIFSQLFINLKARIMKKLNTPLGLLMPFLLLIFIATTTSCGKVEGCTEPNAKNFSADAEEDDGSCTYEGEIVFWYAESVSNELAIDGITALAYYVGGDLVGSSAASIYYTSSPDCGNNGTITVTKDLGSSKSKQYAFKVEDSEDGEVIWEGTLTFNANTCTTVQLTN